MRCPFCRREIAAGARICPHCKHPVESAPASPEDPQTTQLFIAADRSKKMVLWVAIFSVIVLLAIVAYGVSQTRLGSTAERVPIEPTVTRPRPVDQTAADNGPAAGSRAVSDYVDFLAGLEKRRTALRASFDDVVRPSSPGSSASTSAPSPPTPAPGVPAPSATGTTDLASYQQDWLTLVRDFSAQQTPQGCETISNNYYRVLQDYVALLSAAAKASTPDDIARIRADWQPKVQADALTADQSLQQICSADNLSKSFSIDPDLASAKTQPSGQSTNATSAP